MKQKFSKIGTQTESTPAPIVHASARYNHRWDKNMPPPLQPCIQQSHIKSKVLQILVPVFAASAIWLGSIMLSSSEGENVPPCQKAAEDRHHAAQCQLVRRYMQGKGVEKDKGIKIPKKQARSLHVRV